jgi:DNA-binding transcriptional regulator LsrR (DeoR family)
LINPAGAFLDLEELLQRKFGLQQVLIAESSVEPSALVASSGDAYSSRELETIREKGGVGNICFGFTTPEGCQSKSR